MAAPRWTGPLRVSLVHRWFLRPRAVYRAMSDNSKRINGTAIAAYVPTPHPD